MHKFGVIIEGLKKINITFSVVILLFCVAGAVMALTPINLFGQENVTPVNTRLSNGYAGWAFLAAGLSVAASVLGAGIALSRIGSAAMAALAEKPEIMGSAVLISALAEGIAVMGVIVAVLILAKI